MKWSQSWWKLHFLKLYRHSNEAIEFWYTVGPLFGEIRKGWIFHILSMSSHWSGRPAKSTTVTEIFAARELVDDIVILKIFSALYDTQVKALVVVDSKTIHYAVSSKRDTADKSVRQDVNSMTFYFEPVINIFVWIACRQNFADVGTKRNTP